MIYLDYNATTPVDKRVVEAIKEAMIDHWGNPSSGHVIGKKGKKMLDQARSNLAFLLDVMPEEIIFTSGGTESNNMVILGLASHYDPKKRHIITSAIEHPSVLNPCLYLLEKGWDISFVPVDKNGIIDITAFKKAIRPDTFLATIMLANNETGAIQPIQELASICSKHEILLHCDAAQAVGKIEVNIKELGVDYLTVAGHKLYAPKGIGALFVKKGRPLEKILHGAGQEYGWRPGTEPVPAAVGLGMAAKISATKLKHEPTRQQQLRDRLFEGLKNIFPSLVRHGLPDKTLPNTLSVSFPGLLANDLLAEMDKLCASTGAACHDRSVSISHVLGAMGVSKDVAVGTVRLSLGYYTDEDEIDEAITMFESALRNKKAGSSRP